MPQDITINGAQYPDVPAVQIPKTGGGTAQFDDTTDATATASEIASGKSAYVNNTRLVGTGQMVEPPLYIDTTLNSVGVGASPQTANAAEIAQDWRLVANGKYNQMAYVPYSWVATGSSSIGWLRIATITVHDTQFDAPVEFLVQRRHDANSVKLSVLFNSQNVADPTLSGIYYDDISGTRSSNPFQAFIRKTTTSTWSVYVSMSGAYDSISVYTLMPYYAQRWGSVSYAYGFLSSVPSGAVMATHLPNLKPRADTYVVRTSGASWVNTLRFTRDGNVCNLYINIHTDGNTASGANIFIGTVNAPKPPQYITATDYVGSTPIVAGISGGNLYVRNTTPNTISSGVSISFSFVYITDE